MAFHKKIPLRAAWYGLIILASLLPAAVLSPWLSHKAHRLLLDRAMLREEMFHQNIATHLYLGTERLVSILQNKSDPVSYFMSHDKNPAALFSLTKNIIGREPVISSVAIYNRYADMTASAHRGKQGIAAIEKNTPAFVIPMHGRTFIGSPFRLSDNHFEFLISVPLVYDNKNIGVMISAIDINKFWYGIRSKTPEHNSNIYLIDGRGSLLTHRFHSKHQQGDLLSDKEIVRSLIAGKDWQRTSVYKGFEDKDVFGIATLVRGLQWGIISEIPAKGILSPVISALIYLTLIIVIMHILFGLVSLILTKRLLNPVSELAKAVKRAARGDYSLEIIPSSYREIDDLTSSFNTMSHEIEKREHSLRKFSLAIDQAGESILITDRDGIIEYVNPSFTSTTGFSSKDAIGKTPKILNGGVQSQKFYRQLWDTILSGKTWDGMLTNRKKDGTLYPVLMNIAAIRNGSRITHFVAIQQDMSEQNLLEEQLRQSQKMEALGTLVGGIAHNFNNILAGISGNIYLLKKHARARVNLSSRLDNIETLSFRAAEMIQQLLTFARKSIVSIEPIPLTPFINETVKFIHTLLPENICVDLDICADSLQIKGDRTQLQQALINIINNARDALEGRDNPRITFSLEAFQPDSVFIGTRSCCREIPYAHLSVKDNGCGIPEDQRKHLFEPFFTTKEVGKGSGLGLSMAFGAIETHNGFIEVESTENRGAVFHIYIPLMEPTEITPASTRKRSVVERGDGELVLLADDEDNLREIGKEVLQTMGYRVLAAKDGLEALEVFKANREEISIAMLDVVMPHIGGIKLARRIRELNPDLPVIFVTGYDKEYLPDQSEPIKNSVTLSKPVQFDILSHTIRRLLQ